MTVGSTLLTVVLAAIAVAAFATSPLIFGVTIAVALVTLGVLARSLRESVNPPFAPPTLEILLGTSEAADVARDREPADESGPATIEVVNCPLEQVTGDEGLTRVLADTGSHRSS